MYRAELRHSWDTLLMETLQSAACFLVYQLLCSHRARPKAELRGRLTVDSQHFSAQPVNLARKHTNKLL